MVRDYRQVNFIQPDNPTDEERHKMLLMTLEQSNRAEDFNNIIELLSPPQDITTIASPGSCKGIRVGIIGGGIAGLTSAFELRKLGFDITIFETQENRLGGRIYTHYFDADKRFYAELGAMRIPVAHETTWHYINTFGLRTRPFVQNNENALFYVRHKRARNDPQGKSVMENIYPEFDLTPQERVTPWQKLIGDALSSNLYKISPATRKELLQVKREYSLTIEYLGSFGIRRVLEKMGLSEAAIEMISGLAPFLGSFYYNSYTENLIEEYTVDYAYRYEIVGGMVNFPLSFYNSLMSKNPIEYSNIQEDGLGKITWANGKTVNSILRGDIPNKVILEYKDEKTMETHNQSFDYVICTIPFSSLRNVYINPMFSSEKMQAIKEVFYTSSQKTAFMCNERFWERGNDNERIVGGGSNTDLPIQTIWYPSHRNSIENIQEESQQVPTGMRDNSYNEPGVLLSSYNLNLDAIRVGDLEDIKRVEEIKRQVEAVHGLEKGYLDSIVENFITVNWNGEKGFYGAFCYFMPEQQKHFSYAMAKTEYDNRVHFAGEHVSLTHGWIEGSLSTAAKAANEIARLCKSV
ncbi:flavin-dependent L-tryptophan oxidase RebO precursor [Clostridium chromiireducens]|uniref:Flavin-dependent L-tryptophan oxidase RebO n=2 Tax=Clostridium chromiireducens TaxID=225345 RepID=A0A1V4IXE6_9CLOT|nr:flavin-dependent L-tryptophan oxidase RebO precursor [Clostridium chromiireducens]